MKKLCIAILCLLMLFCVSAYAEGVVLPDPGYYFGRSYDGFSVAFNHYPKAEMNAYASLLTENYGMEITEERKMGAVILSSWKSRGTAMPRWLSPAATAIPSLLWRSSCRATSPRANWIPMSLLFPSRA